MNIKHTLFIAFLAVVSTTIFSCGKVNESMERDIIVGPGSTDFTFPIGTSTESGTKIGEIPLSIDFDTFIREQTKDLGIGDARSFKLTSFELRLDSAEEENSLGNFETITVYMQSDSQPKTLVAQLTSNPSSKNGNVLIPIVPNNPELKAFLSSPTFKFTLEGKARTLTTIALKGKAITQYALRVGN